MDSEPSTGIIRTFSDKFIEEQPENNLSQGLAMKVEQDRRQEALPDSTPAEQWKLLLEDASGWALSLIPDDERELFEQSHKLRKAWDKFQHCLPKDQKQNLNGRRPDIKYLFDAVNKATDSWQHDRSSTRFGKAKQTWDDLCSKFLDHQQILSIVPKDDKYISLLAGSLSAIAQASANHQKLAGAVQEGLRDLTQDIDFWNRQMREYQRQNGDITLLNRYVVELYVIVFEFLTEIFEKWSKSAWARFVSSFDEGVFNRLFNDKRGRIDAIAGRMAKEVELKRGQTTDRRLQDMTAKFEELSQQTEANNALQRSLLLALGTDVQHLLQGQVDTARILLSTQMFQRVGPDPGNQGASPARLHEIEGSPDSQSGDGDDTLSTSKPEMPKKRDEILGDLDTLAQRYAQHMRSVAEIALRATRLQIDVGVQRKLLNWISSSGNNKIWIRGPHGVPHPSQNTLTAVNLTALTKDSDIPCIAYFCSVRFDLNLRSLSRADQLLEMLHSIITQLLMTIQEDVDIPRALITQMTALENRSLGVDDALQVIRTLRNSAPRFLHIVIDNIRSLEDSHNEEHSLDLVNTVGTLCDLDSDGVSHETERSDGGEKPTRNVTKVCFTTDGDSDWLAFIMKMKLLDRVDFDMEAGDLRAGNTTRF